MIAIENVRLFKELESRNRDLTEALEQQTATAEILRVLSASPTDLQPVLDTLVASAARFCRAYDVTLFQVDGERLRFPAHHGPIPVPADPTIPLVREFVSGRAVLEQRVVHLADAQAEAERFPEAAAHAKLQGHRTILAAPLLREGVAIGALLLRRTEVDPFTDKQIALLQTFADQAVIAIENVRLFTELQARNSALTQAHAQVSEALDRQTATAEILRTISSSPTDVQPVFTVIVESAVQLCGAQFSAMYHYDGELVRFGAHHGFSPGALDVMRELFPRPVGPETVAGRTISAKHVVHIPDCYSRRQRPRRRRAGAQPGPARGQHYGSLAASPRAVGQAGRLPQTDAAAARPARRALERPERGDAAALPRG